MDRRRFLTLTGASAAGALGGAGMGRARAAEGPDGTMADARLEQSMRPRTGSHRVIWSVDTDEPLAALTFDDGPDPAFTPRILEALAAAGVRATFMMMGHNAARHPGLAREVVAAGHEVGNHTWSHLNLVQVAQATQHEEIVRAADTIEGVTGQRPRYFRPPRGQLTGPAIRSAALTGADTLMWSVERGPRGTSTAAAVADHVRGHLGPGDIMLLHDGIGRGQFDPRARYAVRSRARRAAEVEALPRILADASDRGVRLGTASDLLAAERTEPRPLEDQRA